MTVLNVDNDYARELEAALTPEMLNGLQRAGDLFSQALALVQEAAPLLRAVTDTHQATVVRRHAMGDPLSDDVYDALRDRTAFGYAIDSAFEIESLVKGF